MKTTPETFSPSEVAELTGLSTVMQRDWRRRGHVPHLTEAGWTRLDLFEVCRVLALKTMMDRGIPSADARIPAGVAASTIQSFALVINRSQQAKSSPKVGVLANTDQRYVALSSAGTIVHAKSLADLERVTSGREFKDSVLWTIIDCLRLALIICERTKRPLSVDVVETKEELGKLDRDGAFD